jgi:hypothetical protein
MYKFSTFGHEKLVCDGNFFKYLYVLLKINIKFM